jgi:hypothetical protein
MIQDGLPGEISIGKSDTPIYEFSVGSPEFDNGDSGDLIQELSSFGLDFGAYYNYEMALDIANARVSAGSMPHASLQATLFGFQVPPVLDLGLSVANYGRRSHVHAIVEGKAFYQPGFYGELLFFGQEIASWDPQADPNQSSLNFNLGNFRKGISDFASGFTPQIPLAPGVDVRLDAGVVQNFAITSELGGSLNTDFKQSNIYAAFGPGAGFGVYMSASVLVSILGIAGAEAGIIGQAWLYQAALKGLVSAVFDRPKITAALMSSFEFLSGSISVFARLFFLNYEEYYEDEIFSWSALEETHTWILGKIRFKEDPVWYSCWNLWDTDPECSDNPATVFNEAGVADPNASTPGSQYNPWDASQNSTLAGAMLQYGFPSCAGSDFPCVNPDGSVTWGACGYGYHHAGGTPNPFTGEMMPPAGVGCYEQVQRNQSGADRSFAKILNLIPSAHAAQYEAGWCCCDTPAVVPQCDGWTGGLPTYNTDWATQVVRPQEELISRPESSVLKNEKAETSNSQVSE